MGWFAPVFHATTYGILRLAASASRMNHNEFTVAGPVEAGLRLFKVP
jgi:hypothetical protein